MAIETTYHVRCDACAALLDGEYATREDAEAAREDAGWHPTYGQTRCDACQDATAR
ncbi:MULTISPECIES: hypothetical protein [Streptomyces]|uniref:hypothetical protein n=1 Tax=Streptomyces TaxID=1883 RepID=UPI00186AD3E4|nr:MULTISPECIES: hypothetical protein [Streptomyces]